MLSKGLRERPQCRLASLSLASRFCLAIPTDSQPQKFPLAMTALESCRPHSIAQTPAHYSRADKQPRPYPAQFSRPWLGLAAPSRLAISRLDPPSAAPM